jgi:DNA polymerase, archaea type
MKQEISQEVVNTFLQGKDPMERIITIECDYQEDKVSIIYVDENGEKRIRKDDFHPFVWIKISAAQRLFNGDRKKIMSKLREYNIGIRTLVVGNDQPIEKANPRIENGYRFIFYAKTKMSFSKFQRFFTEGGVPINERQPKGSAIKVESNKEILSVTPIEQYMIASGKRLFKGYENYNDLHRVTFDLETQGLNPKFHRIEQIGVHDNRGYDKIISIVGETEEEKNDNEIDAIEKLIAIFASLKPDIICGHNSENFDWDFIMQRYEMLSGNFQDMTLKYFSHPIYKKAHDAVLKLGGEVEYYKPTVMWGHVILDSLHAARRAQAIDSSMKSSNLKYVTKYLNLNKPNRVYVPGDKITSTWAITSPIFAFNDEDGDWYQITENKPLKDNYKAVSGRYIVERYLLDDIWETDKVEEKLNESNFLVAKMLPTSFTRACTMGTAGIWKLIILAWCYENSLIVPATVPSRTFTGGLSRLLKTGYVDRVVKLDYNSLYPSIILTWNITSEVDESNVLSSFLNYVLTQREKYKGLKAEAGAKADELKERLKNGKTLSDDDKKKIKQEIQYWKGEKSGNDKKQLPLKILGNSIFGSFGASHLFPLGSTDAAERTTCVGRQCLRLMIGHFHKHLHYAPIVGDTDGFNFQMPLESEFRYTDEHPYISNGLGRNSVKGKAYTKIEADVAEFEDIYFNTAWNGGINKMGLGIDEIVESTINFARKNYSDLMLDGSTKKVGNTIKSRKMSGYLETFIDKGVDLLLKGNGYQFLQEYYDYIEKIYNYQIPIKDIATKGNIKKTLKEYIEDCKTYTKAGAKKSRQAWYELAIRENLNVNVSDTIYYINTGTKKGHSDVKRISHFYAFDENGDKIEVTKEIEKLYKNRDKSLKQTRVDILKEKYGNKAYDEDEIILNCKLVPREIVDSEDDFLCSDYEGLEYNVEKYIEQFNKRITPLLVCFSKEIRNDILITDPKDRKFFTETQAVLVSGEPTKETDQDTYEALMTPERKEIEFWVKMGERPPFIEECGIPWDDLVKKYKEETAIENDELYQTENQKYLDALSKITPSDIDAFMNEGIIPSSISSIVTLGSDMRVYFKKIKDKTPSTGGYIIDDLEPSILETNDF